MTEEDFQKRGTSARRGRRCSRLEVVSSGPGEETGAPANGAPVEFRRCDRDVRGRWSVFCEEHDGTLLPEPSGGEVTPETLRIVCEVITEEVLFGVFENKIGEVFHDARPRLGRSREGISDRELLLDAVIGTQDFIRLDSLEEWLEIKKTLRVPSWKAHRRELIGRAVALGGINVEAIADLYDIDRSRPYAWRKRPSVQAWLKTRQKSDKGIEVNLREQLESIDARLAAVDEKVEAVHADVRATLAVVLERFPDSKAVAAAIDEFLENSLAD